jgi:RNA polymerase sigma factor (sigma-70 family)
MVVTAESTLVTQAQAGDRSAFSALYDTYLPKIYDFALGMLRNRSDAEDVTSDTFLKAVERLHTLKEPDAFRGWLYTIARNIALSLVESRKRAVPTGEYDEYASAHNTALMPEPEQALESEELRELVWDAAATLNPRDFQVFELTVRHGLSSAEIAPILDVRPAYAYILVNRLKGSVEEALETVLLTKTGRPACAELDALVTEYGEDATPRLRKAVVRHAKSCATCVETKKTRASVPAILAGMAFAAPSAAFASELASKIDQAWPPASGGGTGSGNGSGDGGSKLAHLVGVGAFVALVVSSIVSLAAAPVDDADRFDTVPVFVETAPETPEPTEASTPEPTRAPIADRPVRTAAPAGPQNTPLVVIIDEGGDGGTVDTGDEEDGNDGGFTRPTQPPQEPDPTQPPKTSDPRPQ